MRKGGGQFWRGHLFLLGMNFNLVRAKVLPFTEILFCKNLISSLKYCFRNNLILFHFEKNFEIY